MLIGCGVFGNRRGVQPRLMRKGRSPDIGRLFGRHTVQNIVQHARCLAQPFKRCQRHAGLELTGVRFFEQKRRNDRDQIGIAATLAQPIERALDLTRPCAHRRQRIGHRIFGVIVGVDADVITRNAAGNHGFGDLIDLLGQRATIGVTQHDPARTGIKCGVHRLQRIGRVGLIAVKEMLGIKQRLAALPDQMSKAGGDILGILGQGDAQRSFDMKFMAFANQTDSRSLRIHHRRQHVVIVRRPACALGHAKGGHHRICLGGGVKEIRIRRIGTRPSALDIIHTQTVQHVRNDLFFACRKLHALGLLPVAQGCIVKIKTFLTHHKSPSLAASKSGPGAHVACPPTSVTCTPAAFRMSRT